MYFDVDSDLLTSFCVINYALSATDTKEEVDDPEIAKLLDNIDDILYIMQKKLDKSYPGWDDNLDEVSDYVTHHMKKLY